MSKMSNAFMNDFPQSEELPGFASYEAELEFLNSLP